MEPKISTNSRLRQFNNLLSFVVLGLGIYISLIPVLPELSLWWQQRRGVDIPYSGAMADASSNGNKSNKPIPADNRLVIPSINVDQPILEGSSIDVVANSGVWRRPNSSNSPEFSNIVLAGHRFASTSPYGAFYHLDKVKLGDILAVYWQGKEYDYQVTETKTIEATAIEIENPTKDRVLTIYTCTPIWSAKQRLVVVAKPINLTKDGQ